MHTAPACTSSMSVCVCSAQKNACLCDGKVLTGQVCLCVSFVRKAHWHPNNEGSNASLRRSIYSGEAHVCVICVCVCVSGPALLQSRGVQSPGRHNAQLPARVIYTWCDMCEQGRPHHPIPPPRGRSAFTVRSTARVIVCAYSHELAPVHRHRTQSTVLCVLCAALPKLVLLIATGPKRPIKKAKSPR